MAIDTDPNNYDTYLQESISHQLAADIAYAVTNNATLANNYMARADERLREARFIDATENTDLGDHSTFESNEFTFSMGRCEVILMPRTTFLLEQL